MPDISDYLGMPINISTHGYDIDYMMGLVHWLMIVLFVIWAFFFIYTLIRFRSGKNLKANHQGVKGHLSSYLEVGIVVAEAFLLIGFAFPLWSELKEDFPSETDAITVNAIAEQFAWNFHYPGPDGIFGKRDISLIDLEVNPIGLDEEDPNALDDIITLNDLHLPKDKPAIIHLSSKDVIHSFSIPVMRIKQDIIPGMVISTWFEPTKTGKYDIACSQLCGLGHYRMRGNLIIETLDEFEEWQKRVSEDE